MQGSMNSWVGKNLTSSAQLATGLGTLGGIFVSAASNTPTIAVYDNTAASGAKLIDTFTPVAATRYTFDVGFSVGLRVVLGGTVSCTPLWVGQS